MVRIIYSPTHNAWPHNLCSLPGRRAYPPPIYHRLQPRQSKRRTRTGQTLAGSYSTWLLVVSTQYFVFHILGETDLSPDVISSLKNHGTEKEVNDMFDMGAETLDLPLEEKMKFEQGDSGYSFG